MSLKQNSAASAADSAEASEAPAGKAADHAPAGFKPGSAQHAPPATPRKALGRRVASIVLPLVLIASGGYGYYWWTVGRFIVSTDDAYVGADNTTLAAKVSGYVVAVEAGDNAVVKAGAVIARLDDGDYRLAERAAEDAIASQAATIERIGRQITAQDAAVDQAKAQLASAEAGSLRAESEFKRQKDLATRDFTSRQALEAAQAARDQSAAAVLSAKAALTAARANVEVFKAQRLEARGTLKQLQTALEKARRDLSFTVIRAPFDGVIGNRAVQVGDYVQPGQRLAALVPLNAVYVDANFKETQLGGLRPGQPVDIRVDAVPGRSFAGTVASLAPASGSVFSLLPPDNATGNFTKVVQRIPARIRLKLSADEQGLLRPGMSVAVRVDTRNAAGPQTITGANAAPRQD
jgi:membrane fusion protein (multidrug efflux system)